MRRFYLSPEEAASETPRITGPEAVHLRTVLRLGPGDPVRIFDGTGMEYDGVIQSADEDGVGLTLSAPVAAQTDSPVRIIMAQAFLKEKKMEAAIRPLTELGIAQWRPFFSSRCVSRPEGARLTKRMERWEKMAMESLKQCRRSRPMDIRVPTPFSEMLAAGRDADLRLLFWEKAMVSLSETASGFFTETGKAEKDAAGAGPAGNDSGYPEKEKQIFAICGPEGGLSDAEAAEARAAGFYPVSLGPRILRAETAILTAAALLQFLFGDL